MLGAFGSVQGGLRDGEWGIHNELYCLSAGSNAYRRHSTDVLSRSLVAELHVTVALMLPPSLYEIDFLPGDRLPYTTT